MKEDLNNCLFCGSEMVVKFNRDSYTYYTECNSCGACGPIATTYDLVVEMYNEVEVLVR